MTATQRTTFDGVRRALMAKLARHPALTARSTDDFSVALLDGWAALAEILGFHSARHHEESSIDLATELGSVIELSRLLGYRPDPGVAATTSLAFTVDESVGAFARISIPRGTAVTSTPDPGEKPVIFETVEEIEGRPVWNAMRPRLGRRQGPMPTTARLLLAGVATNVLPGDGILIPPDGPGKAGFGIVTSVTVRSDDLPTPTGPGRPGWTTVSLALQPPSADLTSTDLSNLLPTPPPPADEPLGPLVGRLTGGTVTTIAAADLAARARAERFDVGELFGALRAARRRPRHVAVFRAQAAILGSGAPEFQSLPKSLRDDLTAPDPFGTLTYSLEQKAALITYAGRPASYASAYVTLFNNKPTPVWADDVLENYPGARSGAAGTRIVFCDTIVRGVGPNSVVLRDGATWQLLSAAAVRVTSKSVFTVSGRSTVVTLVATDLSKFSIRGTTVHMGPEWLPLAEEPELSPLPAGVTEEPLALDDWVEGLRDGQTVAVTGMSAEEPGTVVAHVATLTNVEHVLGREGGTRARLAPPLPAPLIRRTVRINANVAAATHGETRVEVLGNGDARDPFPRFALSAGPLTHVSSGAGSTSALAVYVDGVRRAEVPGLLEAGETGYVVRSDEQARASVQFGSPLPTGQINVRAVYRVGVGPGAAVGAGRLTLLTQRPPGVTGVTNPRPAQGGDDPEGADAARRNAPVSVRALGRVVSLADYGDFARAFPGIHKAGVVWTRAEGRRGVLVTVAGAGGAPVSEDSVLYRYLLKGLRTSGDPHVPVRLVSYQPRSFRAVAVLRIDPDRIADSVIGHAATALRAEFGFDARDLGQPVTAGEVIAVLQGVRGVVAAHLVELHRLVGGAPEGGEKYRPILRAATPAQGGDDATETAAELVTLEAQPPRLTAIAP